MPDHVSVQRSSSSRPGSHNGILALSKQMVRFVDDYLHFLKKCCEDRRLIPPSIYEAFFDEDGRIDERTEDNAARIHLPHRGFDQRDREPSRDHAQYRSVRG